MNIAIFGGTGFIGRAITAYWLEQGHQVIIVGREKGGGNPLRSKPDDQAAFQPSLLSYVTWSELEKDVSPLEEADAFVNLAGATLNTRWSEHNKRRILESRLTATKRIARFVRALPQPPEVILQASAVGIYGTSLTKEFDETSPLAPDHADFLSEVTSAWEAAADEGFSGQRLVKLRIGVVLGNDGGAYPLMRLPYLLGAGGPIGSGRQWVPWIHLQDIVSLFDYALTHPDIRGPVNAVSPNPATNEQFGRILCRVYRRPFWLPLPSAMLKSLLGERSMLLLDGQKVLPAAALRAGFTFAYPELEQAATNLRGQK
ncbi:TIGR01777 family oxidoreductase [Paenibacillus macerans]|uniref:TIGR01777 family oxidoreductase n=1 Tax=Paenibacillus macerans TaxID=44252 RepID=UPI00203FECCE|nr:TIGR01777 family oxidoreductase [Paenibacillus macerans]MCM3699931.1 TIGR01777 family oxidoreductase [Paenibacillus macerans]